MRSLLCILLLIIMGVSCQKEIGADDNIVTSLPTLTTTAATSITSTTAASGGNITNDGGDAITARGICWSTTTNPIVTASHTTDGTGSGSFSSNLTGLAATTVYYVRAYATNSVGTAYGNEISFTTTNSSTALPTVTTTSLSAITMATTAGGGNVVTDGGAPVTARGVCWGTSADPTIALTTKTTDGTGTGIFTSALTGLTAATTYHVRAYATNSVGTSYGGDSTFTTASSISLPTVTTLSLSAITMTTATGAGNVFTDGGAAVTARGVCWSTTPNPTIALATKTSDGTGTGSFTSALTGLTAGTTYHVRAYATNSVGTAYGNDVSFSTTSTGTPNVYVSGFDDLNTYEVATIWKNGVASNLDIATPTVSDGNSVFVSGSDVYVAGDDDDPAQIGLYHAALWKNGVETLLTNGTGSSTAYSVFVSGTDVYVAGFENNATNAVAKIWKNGVATSLTNGANDAMAYSVFVSGTDVYATGYELIGSHYVARLWKNGVASSLTNGTEDAEGYSVFVSGSDVYVAGHENIGTRYIAKIWKNGVATSLTNGTTDAEAYNVFVSGSDVYAVGYENSGPITAVAKLWKNGVSTSFSNGVNSAYASGVYVYGTDVYISGYEDNGTADVAKFWKNGVATNLTSGARDGAAYSIFVK